MLSLGFSARSDNPFDTIASISTVISLGNALNIQLPKLP